MIGKYLFIIKLRFIHISFVFSPSPIDYDLSGSNYADPRGYSDRYHPYPYSGPSGNSHYNNHHRMNNNPRHNNTLSTHDHPDRRARHGDDYIDSRNDNRNRKDKSSTQDR